MSNATDHVIRNLQSETSVMVEAGRTFPTDDVDAYQTAAKRWLGDNSELRTGTLEEADWTEVYNYFTT